MSSLALSFNDVNFSPVQHNNQIWLTASELAKALGYAKSDAVTQIYERNKDEFNSEMTLTLKLSVKGFGNGNSLKETRIFNPRGCHLITFFARTSVAKQFRKWVLDVLDKEIGAPVAKTHKSEREPLTNAVNLLVAKTKHLNYSDAYKLVHQRFNVQHIDEIPHDVIPVAVEYVHHLIAMYSRAEKYKDTEPHIHTVLRDKDVQFLMWYVPILAKFIKNEIYPALTAIQSNYAGRLSGLASETVCHANALNRKAIGYGLTLEHVGNKSPHDIEWYLAH
ncbi:BRO-N domain-containing protein [Acinetobacter nosocomialis]|uniref:BRO-N domain-containing protein n=1 Tax=Acinetobacter nosocomialis TaxID=106654 RepID=UPI0023B1B75A|nr:BRO family protein [Acinetobacter nosocomialis]MDE9415724.1 BRO family protein [Acinetobacter nosocomialis]